MGKKELDVVPGLEGIPAAESSISYIDGEKGILEYRGIPIGELAEESTFLETSYLLTMGKLPSQTELSKFVDDITHHTYSEPEAPTIGNDPSNNPMADRSGYTSPPTAPQIR